MVSRLFLLPGGARNDPAVDAWLGRQRGELGAIARQWFESVRDCGDDVRELMHDGAPTACVGDAAFVYVNAYVAHVSIGFFHGAELEDPERLLQGTGKFMRHVKLRPDEIVDRAALQQLIERAYAAVRDRVAAR